MHGVVKGLVLHGVDVKEKDKMLTVYTEERGLMSIYVTNAKSSKNKRGAACSDFAYSEFTIVERGDKIWLESVSPIRIFSDPSFSLYFLTLATYVCETVRLVATEEPDRELMRLALNTLHAASSGKGEPKLLKAAFEIRLLSLLGFMPQVAGCHSCGVEDGEFVFDIMSGVIECRECLKEREALAEEGERRTTCIISSGARTALDYCARCPLERLFSFTLAGEDLELFATAAETFAIHQLERSFNSLEYYHKLKSFLCVF